MTSRDAGLSLEEQIERWRSYLRRRQAIHAVDVAELEDHLREQVASLQESGLAVDEAFLVAVKRMGELDALSREFAREHSERLWKQLVVSRAADSADGVMNTRNGFIAFGFALLAAIAIKVPALFGVDVETDWNFYARNLSFFVLLPLTAYFSWKRQLDAITIGWLAMAFAAAAVFANSYPFTPQGYTEILTVLHLPIALWLAVGVAYAGSRWQQVAGRMDFIRFTGELLIYFVLIALGGIVLVLFMLMIFASIGLDLEPLLQRWILPCGAAGAVVVAAWLVEAKQSVVENMAPVLTRLFTPFFVVLLLAFLLTLILTGRGIDVERNLLIAFDLLLVVVIGLLLYSISARDPQAPPGIFDVLQLVLIVSALLADMLALGAIAARIGEFGFSPNRVAALGENVILLINLIGSALLYFRFLRGRAPISKLERWQTNYLPVYAAWAAVVIVLFPPVFGFA